MMKKISFLLLLSVAVFALSGCGEGDSGKSDKLKEWEENAGLLLEETPEELYEKALEEETLMIYSVTSRIFDVKKAFEEEYPGLTVTIKDMRGDDVVDMLKSNYENEDYSCDLVICSDCNGSLYKELLEPDIVYTYIPYDIAPNLKDGTSEDGLEFMGETMMLFYNEDMFDKAPVSNLWELTEEHFKGKIIMANPLKSFSTYEFCVALNAEGEKLSAAYKEHFGKEIELPEGKSPGELFWEKAARNIVFTNSSDEVIEEIGSSDKGNYVLGVMLSSKMRYLELGYHITPIYDLKPFGAVYTPNCVTIAGGAKNINSAKLFIRYMLGEADGKGKGAVPFSTIGTWSVRNDVADGNDIGLDSFEVIYPDREFIYESREESLSFWEKLLEENVDR